MNGTWISNGSMANRRGFRLRNRSDISSASVWDSVAVQEWTKFQIVHDKCISIFDKAETTLLVVGLFGNALALITLLCGRQMRTPSFVYHKALVLAYLTYCLNFLIVKYVNTALTTPSERRQLNFYSPLAAYYAVILNRVITSVCGYVALYTSLAISVDRFLALVLFKRYHKFNKHFVAYLWVLASVSLSVSVHSWAPWFENSIHADAMPVDSTGNRSVVVYRHSVSVNHDRLKKYIMVKDWYNLVVRFVYAILLTALTLTVIYMFAEQQKRRSALRNISKRQLRRERSLFYLMIAVVIMAYIQVIPRESKRILELVYPPEYVASKIEDESLSVGTRKMYLLFGLYGFTLTTPILNLCTTVERSLIFYLYFALNHSFRREVLSLLRLSQAWTRVLAKFGIAEPSSDQSRRESDVTTRISRAANKELRSEMISYQRSSRRLYGSDASHGDANGCLLRPPSLRSSSRSFQTTCSEYASSV